MFFILPLTVDWLELNNISAQKRLYRAFKKWSIPVHGVQRLVWRQLSETPFKRHLGSPMLSRTIAGSSQCSLYKTVASARLKCDNCSTLLISTIGLRFCIWYVYHARFRKINKNVTNFTVEAQFSSAWVFTYHAFVAFYSQINIIIP